MVLTQDIPKQFHRMFQHIDRYNTCNSSNFYYLSLYVCTIHCKVILYTTVLPIDRCSQRFAQNLAYTACCFLVYVLHLFWVDFESNIPFVFSNLFLFKLFLLIIRWLKRIFVFQHKLWLRCIPATSPIPCPFPTLKSQHPTCLFPCQACLFLCPVCLFICPVCLFLCPACLFPCPACLFLCPACLFPWQACLFPWQACLFPYPKSVSCNHRSSFPHEVRIEIPRTFIRQIFSLEWGNLTPAPPPPFPAWTKWTNLQY